MQGVLNGGGGPGLPGGSRRVDRDGHCGRGRFSRLWWPCGHSRRMGHGGRFFLTLSVDEHNITPCRKALHIAGWSSLVARRAHNPKVVGSNPAPATSEFAGQRLRASGLFLFDVIAQRGRSSRHAVSGRPRASGTTGWREIKRPLGLAPNSGLNPYNGVVRSRCSAKDAGSTRGLMLPGGMC